MINLMTIFIKHDGSDIEIIINYNTRNVNFEDFPVCIFHHFCVIIIYFEALSFSFENATINNCKRVRTILQIMRTERAGARLRALAFFELPDHESSRSG